MKRNQRIASLLSRIRAMEKNLLDASRQEEREQLTDERVSEAERALVAFQTEQLEIHIAKAMSGFRVMERKGREIAAMLDADPKLRNTPKLALLRDRLDELEVTLKALWKTIRG